jgi:hypothetical protein
MTSFEAVDLGRRAAVCLGDDCGSCCEQEPRDAETEIFWRLDVNVAPAETRVEIFKRGG